MHGMPMTPRVFEVCVHPELLHAACAGKPDGVREVLIEHACQHVERASQYQIDRYRRWLQVSAEP